MVEDEATGHLRTLHPAGVGWIRQRPHSEGRAGEDCGGDVSFLPNFPVYCAPPHHLIISRPSTLPPSPPSPSLPYPPPPSLSPPPPPPPSPPHRLHRPSRLKKDFFFFFFTTRRRTDAARSSEWRSGRGSTWETPPTTSSRLNTQELSLSASSR